MGGLVPHRHPPARLIRRETRVGRHYALNYDRFLADPTIPLFAVADSECDDGNAGDTVMRSLAEARSELGAAASSNPDLLERILLDAIRAAHASIVSIPKGARGHCGGAAVTVVSQCGDVGIIVHIGDCRVYVREGRGWVRRTTDHTLLELERAQGIQPTELGQSLSTITRAVGVSVKCDIDVRRFRIDSPTEVLLCTRGAWMPTDPDGLASPLPAELDGSATVDVLLDNYLRHGEVDNATFVTAALAAS